MWCIKLYTICLQQINTKGDRRMKTMAQLADEYRNFSAYEESENTYSDKTEPIEKELPIKGYIKVRIRKTQKKMEWKMKLKEEFRENYMDLIDGLMNLSFFGRVFMYNKIMKEIKDIYFYNEKKE